MRHLYGTALAIIMSAALFFGGAWGYLRLLRLPAAVGGPAALPAGGGSLLTNQSVLMALGAVVGTGILAGILIAVPLISPLASGLPGILLLGWTGLFLSSVRSAVDIIPLRSQAFGAGWEALLYNGVLGAVGVAMIIPMFIPSRWRLRQLAEDEELEAMAAESDHFLAGLRDARGQRRVHARRETAPELIGTVIPRSPGLVQGVDTSTVTGASRALRNSGPMPRASTGPMPRASTGPIPRASTGPIPAVGRTSSTGPIRMNPGSYRQDAGQYPASDPYPSRGQHRAGGPRPWGRNAPRRRYEP